MRQSLFMTLNRQHISSGSPHEASIGFSRAVRVADRVIVSGTAPIWADGSCDPDPGVQAKRCLEIIFSALADAGATGGDVIRTRMFIADRADADAVAQAHGQAFTDVRPASSMIVVSGFLDARWRVEIEAEAVVG
jgi:enamine deaminase RidA (YjgF/YER057c/UK114 family)